jgi:hypothetical protein
VRLIASIGGDFPFSFLAMPRREAAPSTEPTMEGENVEVTVLETTAVMDLDSQPLNDLGVSVMDQDELERNVAAQVGSAGLGWDLTVGGCGHVETR